MFKALMGGGRSSDARSKSSKRPKSEDKPDTRSISSRKSSRGDDRDRGLGDLSSYPSRSKRRSASAAGDSVASFMTAEPEPINDDDRYLERTPKRRESDRESRSSRHHQRDRSTSPNQGSRSRGMRHDSDDELDQERHRRGRERTHSGDPYAPAISPHMPSSAPGAQFPTDATPGLSQFPTQHDNAGHSPEHENYDPHVHQQFPGQFPETVAQPYLPPNPAGAAADYYGDQGESVEHQPGIRPARPAVLPNTQAHLMAASPSANPPPEPSSMGQTGAAAAYFDDDFHAAEDHPPARPPKPSKPSGAGMVPAAALATAATYGIGNIESHAESYEAEQQSSYNQHNQPVTYSPSMASASQRPPKPLHSHSLSEGAALAAAGAAGGYMVGHHHHSSSPEQVNMPPYAHGNPDSLHVAGPGGHATHAIHNPGFYPHGPSALAMRERQRGAVGRFVDFWRDPEGVGRFEDYTESIGVCKYCFQPGTTSADAPRKHHYQSRRRRHSGDQYSSGSSRVSKSSRYNSSDDESPRRKKSNKSSSWLPGMLAGYATKSLFSSKEFNDSYNIRPGPPKSSHGEEDDRRSSTSRGVTRRSDRSPHRDHHSESKRPHSGYSRTDRSRSRSSSRSGRHSFMKEAALGAAVGGAAYAATKSHNRSRSSSPGKSHRRKDSTSSSSFVNVSRPAKKSVASGIGSFFTSSSENRTKRQTKKRRGFFSFNGGSSSSSLDNDLAFGDGFRKKSSKLKKKDKKNKDVDAALLGLGATANRLAGSSPQGSGRSAGQIYTAKPRHSNYASSATNDEEWVDESDDQSSASSALAFGASSTDSSSDSTSSKWGWRWGSKKSKKSKKTDKRSSASNAALAAGAGAIGAAVISSARHHNDDKLPNSTDSLQQVYPMPMPDSSRRDISQNSPLRDGDEPTLVRPGPIPLQQPQPFAPVSQSVYTTQGPPAGSIPAYTAPVYSTGFEQYDKQYEYSRDAPKDPTFSARKSRHRSGSSPIFPTQEHAPQPKRRSTGKDQASVTFDLTEEQVERERHLSRVANEMAGHPVELIDHEDEFARRDTERHDRYWNMETAKHPGRSHGETDSSSWVGPAAAGVIGAAATSSILSHGSDDRYSQSSSRHEERRNRRSLERYRYTSEPDTSTVSTMPPTESIHDEVTVEHYEDQEPRSTRRGHRDPTYDSYADFYAPEEFRHSSEDYARDRRSMPTIDEVEPTTEQRRTTDTYAYEPYQNVENLPWPVPRLNFIEPTPPHSVSGGSVRDATPPSAPVYASKRDRSTGSRVSWGEHETHEYEIPSSSEQDPLDYDSREISPKDVPLPASVISAEEVPLPGAEASSNKDRKNEYDTGIEFAATIAAATAAAGFDPSLVTNDASYHTRTSPPGSEDGVDPKSTSPWATAKHDVFEGEDFSPKSEDISPCHVIQDKEELFFDEPTALEGDISGRHDKSISQEAIQHLNSKDASDSLPDRDIDTFSMPGGFEAVDSRDLVDDKSPFTAPVESQPKYQPGEWRVKDEFEISDFQDPEYSADASRSIPSAPETGAWYDMPTGEMPERYQSGGPSEMRGPVVSGPISMDEASETKPHKSRRTGDLYEVPYETAGPLESRDDVFSAISAPTTREETSKSRRSRRSDDNFGISRSRDVSRAREDTRSVISEPGKSRRSHRSKDIDSRHDTGSPTPDDENSDERRRRRKRRSKHERDEAPIDDDARSAITDIADDDKSERRKHRHRSSKDFDDAASITSAVTDVADGKSERRKRHHRSSRDFDDTASVLSSPARISESRERRKAEEKKEKSGGFLKSLFGSQVSASDERARSDRSRDHSRSRSVDKRSSRDAISEAGVDDERRHRKKRSSKSRSSSNGDDLGSYHSDENKGESNLEEYRSSRQRKQDERRHKYESIVDSGRTRDSAKVYNDDVDDVLNEGPDTATRQTTKDLGPDDTLQQTPRSRSISPPNVEKALDLTLKSKSEVGSPDAGRQSPQRRHSVAKSAESPTAVPLHFRRPPTSPSVTRSGPVEPISSPGSPQRQRRPGSVEFRNSREIRPLWLVERHASAKAEPEAGENLPSLPSSKDSSRVPSVEDLKALNDDGMQSWEYVDLSKSITDRPNLAISADSSAMKEGPEDALDSQQVTPTARRFVENKGTPRYEFHSPSELLQDPTSLDDLTWDKLDRLPSVEGSVVDSNDHEVSDEHRKSKETSRALDALEGRGSGDPSTPTQENPSFDFTERGLPGVVDSAAVDTEKEPNDPVASTDQTEADTANVVDQTVAEASHEHMPEEFSHYIPAEEKTPELEPSEEQEKSKESSPESTEQTVEEPQPQIPETVLDNTETPQSPKTEQEAHHEPEQPQEVEPLELNQMQDQATEGYVDVSEAVPESKDSEALQETQIDPLVVPAEGDTPAQPEADVDAIQAPREIATEPEALIASSEEAFASRPQVEIAPEQAENTSKSKKSKNKKNKKKGKNVPTEESPEDVSTAQAAEETTVPEQIKDIPSADFENTQEQPPVPDVPVVEAPTEEPAQVEFETSAEQSHVPVSPDSPAVETPDPVFADANETQTAEPAQLETERETPEQENTETQAKDTATLAEPEIIPGTPKEDTEGEDNFQEAVEEQSPRPNEDTSPELAEQTPTEPTEATGSKAEKRKNKKKNRKSAVEESVSERSASGLDAPQETQQAQPEQLEATLQNDTEPLSTSGDALASEFETTKDTELPSEPTTEDTVSQEQDVPSDPAVPALAAEVEPVKESYHDLSEPVPQTQIETDPATLMGDDSPVETQEPVMEPQPEAEAEPEAEPPAAPEVAAEVPLSAAQKKKAKKNKKKKDKEDQAPISEEPLDTSNDPVREAETAIEEPVEGVPAHEEAPVVVLPEDEQPAPVETEQILEAEQPPLTEHGLGLQVSQEGIASADSPADTKHLEAPAEPVVEAEQPTTEEAPVEPEVPMTTAEKKKAKKNKKKQQKQEQEDIVTAVPDDIQSADRDFQPEAEPTEKSKEITTTEDAVAPSASNDSPVEQPVAPTSAEPDVALANEDSPSADANPDPTVDTPSLTEVEAPVAEEPPTPVEESPVVAPERDAPREEESPAESGAPLTAAEKKKAKKNKKKQKDQSAQIDEQLAVENEPTSIVNHSPEQLDDNVSKTEAAPILEAAQEPEQPQAIQESDPAIKESSAEPLAELPAPVSEAPEEMADVLGPSEETANATDESLAPVTVAQEEQDGNPAAEQAALNTSLDDKPADSTAELPSQEEMTTKKRKAKKDKKKNSEPVVVEDEAPAAIEEPSAASSHEVIQPTEEEPKSISPEEPAEIATSEDTAKPISEPKMESAVPTEETEKVEEPSSTQETVSPEAPAEVVTAEVDEFAGMNAAQRKKAKREKKKRESLALEAQLSSIKEDVPVTPPEEETKEEPATEELKDSPVEESTESNSAQQGQPAEQSLDKDTEHPIDIKDAQQAEEPTAAEEVVRPEETGVDGTAGEVDEFAGMNAAQRKKAKREKKKRESLAVEAQPSPVKEDVLAIPSEEQTKEELATEPKELPAEESTESNPAKQVQEQQQQQYALDKDAEPPSAINDEQKAEELPSVPETVRSEETPVDDIAGEVDEFAGMNSAQRKKAKREKKKRESLAPEQRISTEEQIPANPSEEPLKEAQPEQEQNKDIPASEPAEAIPAAQTEQDSPGENAEHPIAEEGLGAEKQSPSEETQIPVEDPPAEVDEFAGMNSAQRKKAKKEKKKRESLALEAQRTAAEEQTPAIPSEEPLKEEQLAAEEAKDISTENPTPSISDKNTEHPTAEEGSSDSKEIVQPEHPVQSPAGEVDEYAGMTNAQKKKAKKEKKRQSVAAEEEKPVIPEDKVEMAPVEEEQVTELAPTQDIESSLKNIVESSVDADELPKTEEAPESSSAMEGLASPSVNEGATDEPEESIQPDTSSPAEVEGPTPAVEPVEEPEENTQPPPEPEVPMTASQKKKAKKNKKKEKSSELPMESPADTSSGVLETQPADNAGQENVPEPEKSEELRIPPATTEDVPEDKAPEAKQPDIENLGIEVAEPVSTSDGADALIQSETPLDPASTETDEYAGMTAAQKKKAKKAKKRQSKNVPADDTPTENSVEKILTSTDTDAPGLPVTASSPAVHDGKDQSLDETHAAAQETTSTDDPTFSQVETSIEKPFLDYPPQPVLERSVNSGELEEVPALQEGDVAPTAQEPDVVESTPLDEAKTADEVGEERSSVPEAGSLSTEKVESTVDVPAQGVSEEQTKEAPIEDEDSEMFVSKKQKKKNKKNKNKNEDAMDETLASELEPCAAEEKQQSGTLPLIAAEDEPENTISNEANPDIVPGTAGEEQLTGGSSSIEEPDSEQPIDLSKEKTELCIPDAGAIAPFTDEASTLDTKLPLNPVSRDENSQDEHVSPKAETPAQSADILDNVVNLAETPVEQNEQSSPLQMVSAREASLELPSTGSQLQTLDNSPQVVEQPTQILEGEQLADQPEAKGLAGPVADSQEELPPAPRKLSKREKKKAAAAAAAAAAIALTEAEESVEPKSKSVEIPTAIPEYEDVAEEPAMDEAVPPEAKKEFKTETSEMANEFMDVTTSEPGEVVPRESSEAIEAAEPTGLEAQLEVLPKEIAETPADELPIQMSPKEEEKVMEQVEERPVDVSSSSEEPVITHDSNVPGIISPPEAAEDEAKLEPVHETETVSQDASEALKVEFGSTEVPTLEHQDAVWEDTQHVNNVDDGGLNYQASIDVAPSAQVETEDIPMETLEQPLAGEEMPPVEAEPQVEQAAEPETTAGPLEGHLPEAEEMPSLSKKMSKKEKRKAKKDAGITGQSLDQQSGQLPAQAAERSVETVTRSAEPVEERGELQEPEPSQPTFEPEVQDGLEEVVPEHIEQIGPAEHAHIAPFEDEDDFYKANPTPDSSARPIHQDEDWPAIDWEQKAENPQQLKEADLDPEPTTIAEQQTIEEFEVEDSSTPKEPLVEKEEPVAVETSSAPSSTAAKKNKKKNKKKQAQEATNSDGPVQALTKDIEPPARTTTPGGTKISQIFPNLERAGFKRSLETLAPKGDVDEPKAASASSPVPTQTREAAQHSEQPSTLEDQIESAITHVKSYDNIPATENESTWVPENEPPTQGSRSLDAPVSFPTQTSREVQSPEFSPEQADEDLCELRRSPSIHGRHQSTPRAWSLDEPSLPAPGPSSPPRSLFGGPSEDSFARPHTPLDPIAEQEPREGREATKGRHGTPRLEIKPEHVLPRPHTPVRKFTDTAFDRESWPTDESKKITHQGSRDKVEITKTPEQGFQILKPSTSSGKLRRTKRSVSGDLRAASRSQPSCTDLDQLPSSSSYDPVTDKGKRPMRNMSDVYEGWGETPSSPRSPSRPPSVRRRRSMQHLQDIETRLDQLISENRLLIAARDEAEDKLRNASVARRKSDRALNTRDDDLRDRDAEVEQLKNSVEWLQKETSRLTQENETVTASNAALAAAHAAEVNTVRETAASELAGLQSQHAQLSSEISDRVRQEIESALAQKDIELRRLRTELEEARDKVKELQQQISASVHDNALVFRDEEYFDAACQKLCGHVQSWVVRFSKHNDKRRCRSLAELQDEKIADRFDNALLDGSDPDAYLSDRVRRRDIFMSVVMTMVWEYIFTRYLFGMDREQRQKLKSLEKQLGDVGPERAVHRWRATTLTLLSRRPAFAAQREDDTEAVTLEIFQTLSRVLPPPSHVESQLLDNLRKIMRVAVNLSLEMRTQLAEFIMLPPLQPEYDTNGDLARKVYFNAALMNERSGLTDNNEELEAQQSVVRIVLFPLVVKKGNDVGEGDDEVVVCPAQVLIAQPSKDKKVSRMMSGDRMSIDASKSVHSIAPSFAPSSMMDASNMI